MYFDPSRSFFDFLILVLAIFSMVAVLISMFAVVGIKKRLDDQTQVLRKMLEFLNPQEKVVLSGTNKLKHGITQEGDKFILNGESYSSFEEAAAKAVQNLMEKYGITKEGDKFKFQEYSYGKLSDAVAYAEQQASKNKY